MSHFGDLISGKKPEPVVKPKTVEPKVTVKKTPSEDKIKL